MNKLSDATSSVNAVITEDPVAAIVSAWERATEEKREQALLWIDPDCVWDVLSNIVGY
jgi:hypothetical protein